MKKFVTIPTWAWQAAVVAIALTVAWTIRFEDLWWLILFFCKPSGIG